VFERFTDSARGAVVLAGEQATDLRHGYVGSEHVLLGVLADGGAGAAALAPVTLAGAREAVAREVRGGDEGRVGQRPLTPRAKQVLELAKREAVALGEDHVGTEHLALALLDLRESTAARLLVAFGLDAETVRAAVAGTAPESVPSARVVRLPRLARLIPARLGPSDRFSPEVHAAVAAAHAEVPLGRRVEVEDLVAALSRAADATPPADARVQRIARAQARRRRRATSR